VDGGRPRPTSAAKPTTTARNEQRTSPGRVVHSHPSAPTGPPGRAARHRPRLTAPTTVPRLQPGRPGGAAGTGTGRRAAGAAAARGGRARGERRRRRDGGEDDRWAEALLAEAERVLVVANEVSTNGAGCALFRALHRAMMPATGARQNRATILTEVMCAGATRGRGRHEVAVGPHSTAPPGVDAADHECRDDRRLSLTVTDYRWQRRRRRAADETPRRLIYAAGCFSRSSAPSAATAGSSPAPHPPPTIRHDAPSAAVPRRRATSDSRSSGRKVTARRRCAQKS